MRRRAFLKAAIVAIVGGSLQVKSVIVKHTNCLHWKIIPTRRLENEMLNNYLSIKNAKSIYIALCTGDE